MVSGKYFLEVCEAKYWNWTRRAAVTSTNFPGTGFDCTTGFDDCGAAKNARHNTAKENPKRNRIEESILPSFGSLAAHEMVPATLRLTTTKRGEDDSGLISVERLCYENQRQPTEGHSRRCA